MLVKTKAIVLSALRYQEKSLIVKCYTESDGLKSYYVRDAFSSKRSSQKIVYFRPLTILEIEASHKNRGTLEHLKEIKIAYPYFSINTDITKTTIAIFVAEMLHNSIREEEKNPEFYTYLEAALLWLDNNEESANFHLILLLEITKFLGFYPNPPKEDSCYFEMTEGTFTIEASLSCLTVEETNLFLKLLPLKLNDASRVFHFTERRQLLKILMEYFSLHLEGFIRPKSFEVLKEVFG